MSIDNLQLELARMPAPAFSPHHYEQIQQAITDVKEDLRQLVPALTDIQKADFADMLGIDYMARGVLRLESLESFGVDEVTAQYNLVKLLQSKVMRGENELLESSSAKDISALINAINSTVGLFLRAEERIDRLRDMQRLREATVYALQELPDSVKQKFFKRLEEFEGAPNAR